MSASETVPAGKPPSRGGVSAPDPLAPGRRAVLYALRRRGEATAEQVAEQLGMTVSGARQHLTGLVEHGLADAREVASTPTRRGRRLLAYTTTDAADVYFPKAYGELTNELLGYVAARDPALIEDLFVERREHRIASARAHVAKRRSPRARVAELAEILDEDGYLATCERIGPGAYRIVEHNCAIWAVASRYGQACTSELEFLRMVLPEASVERVRHMVAGASHCAYEVRFPSGSGHSSTG